jgi:hypothetical protein
MMHSCPSGVRCRRLCTTHLLTPLWFAGGSGAGYDRQKKLEVFWCFVLVVGGVMSSNDTQGI